MSPEAEFNTSRLVVLSDWGPTTTVLVALVAVAVLGLAWHNVRGQPRARRLTLLGLRALAVAMLFAVFLEPGLRLENVTRVRNHLVFMVDASRSMALPADGDRTRMEAVQAALADAAPALEGWRNLHSVDFYATSDHARPVGRPDEIAPNGDATRLVTGLMDLASRYRPEDLAGVVVFSDGADNGALGAYESGQELPAAAREAVVRLGVPITTVFSGPDAPVKDVALADVHYDEFAFVHNAVSIEADVTVQGYDTLSLPVTLRRDEAILGTRVLELDKSERGPDGVTRSHFKFDFVPDKTGKAIFTLEVGTAPGEPIVVNNTRQFVVRIIRDKIRVLQVVGRPSWDQRFLRQLLKRNPNVDLISFFILRTNSNITMASQSDLSLIPFPTEELFKEQLGSFDLIVFQNFTYRGYNMDAYLPLIRDFVHKGGGFVMIGGDQSFSEGGYAGTPIESFLPVALRRERGGSAETAARFRPTLTEAGRRHPITALSLVPEENTALWAGLPELSGYNRVAGLKPGAVVLLEDASEAHAPVVLAHEFGEGRVLAVTTDSTWHWDLHAAEKGDNRHYYKFWGNAIRWLIKDPALQPVRVQADRERYPLGNEATFTARVAGRDYLPAPDTEVVIEVERFEWTGAATQSRIVKHEAGRTNEQGELVVRFKPEEDGAYRVRARALIGGAEAGDEDPFVVAADPAELRETRARPETLRALAEASGGRALRLRDGLGETRRQEPQVSRVNRRRDVPLWASAWWLLVAVLFPSAEWYLRRRWGLL